MSRRIPRDEEDALDPEIRALVQEYTEAVRSIPPPPNKEIVDKDDAEARVIVALAKKLESLDKSRHNLAQQLGSTIRDSGTFEQIGQDQLDNMMLRAEITRLTAENSELKDVIKVWTNRKHDWSIRVIFGAVTALVVYVWTQITAARK